MQRVRAGLSLEGGEVCAFPPIARSNCAMDGADWLWMVERYGRKRTAITALAAVSLLGALESLRGDVLPGPFRAAAAWPGMERQALAWAEMALGAGLLALVRRRGLSLAAAREAVVAGLGLFAAPALLVQLAGDGIPSLTRVAVFGITPVVAVVLEPYLGTRETGRGGLGAALAALAGMLLVFPVGLPGTPAQALSLGCVVLASVCVAAANCRAVWAAELRGDGSARAAVAAATTAFALGLVTERWVAPSGLGAQAAWTLAVELPALLLLFWLMARMTPARMTLRFVLAPLMASVAGLLLFLPAVSGRAAAGLVLMACGAAWMLVLGDAGEGSWKGLGLDRGQID